MDEPFASDAEASMSTDHVQWLSKLERLAEGDLSSEEQAQLVRAASEDPELARLVELYAPLSSGEIRRLSLPPGEVRRAMGKAESPRPRRLRFRRGRWMGGMGVFAAASAAVLSLTVEPI